MTLVNQRLGAAALLLTGALLSGAVTTGAWCEEVVTDPAPASGAAADGAQVFEAAYFAVFNPVTAYDMVRQVPGFTIDDGDNRRGFGATAGNVLINGERPSTKSGVSGELQRIASGNVVRVELLRGGAANVDVRGQTVLVNVVLAEGAEASPSSTYIAELTHNMGGRIGWYGQLTRSLRLAGADVNLNLQLPSGMARSRTDELLTLPNGELVEVRDEHYQDNYREIVLSGTAGWRPTPRDAVNLSVRGSTWRYDGDERSDVVDAQGDRVRSDVSGNEETESHFYELGADWERQLTPRTSIKLVGLESDVGWSYAQLFETFAPDGGLETFLIDSPGGRGERIGRGTFTWRPNGSHTFEVGIEGAFNHRDTDFSLQFDDGASRVVIDVPVASTRVEELRGEAFATDVWVFSPKLTLEAGFTFEASRITQSGDAEQERELTYPKPRLIATRSLDENDQLRLSLVRDVAQLNFGEFASAVSLNNDTVTIGNPNLEPERTWQARAEWERRFGQRGAVTLTGFYDGVESVQDFVVLDVDNDGPGDGDNDGVGDFTGPGNLGDGVRWGGAIEGVAPLDGLGLRNAQLRFEGQLQRTSVDDPVTGEVRSFTDEADWEYSLDFRQDLPARRLAWGWDYFSEGELQFFRADELQVFDSGEGDFDAFIETTRWGVVTLRFSVDNIFDAVDTNERFFFQDTRASGVIERQELRDRRFGRFYSIRVSGSL
jgi:hypothetical protein